MKNKTAVIILLGVISIRIAYFFKNQNTKKKEKEYYKEAIRYMDNSEYKKAIVLFEKINDKTKSIYLKMAECYSSIKNYQKAIDLIDLCLEDSLNIELLEKRYVLKKKNRDIDNLFKDVFLLNLLTQKYRDETTFLLKKISEKRAQEYKICGWTSKICFKEFFDTIVFLHELNDRVAVLINSEEYLECYNYVNDRDGEVELFVRGCIRLVNGDWVGAVKAFKEKEFIYSRIICMWLETRKNKDMMGLAGNDGEKESLEELIMDDGRIRMVESDNSGGNVGYDKGVLEDFSETKDATLLFYIAKIYENLDDKDMQMKFIEKCLEAKRTAHCVGYRLVSLIKKHADEEIEGVIHEALDEFPDDVNIYCISIEYFIIVQNLEKAQELLGKLEGYELKDPRVYILKFLVSKLAGEPRVEYLKESIRIDPLYLKAYVFLGKEVIESEEAVKILEDALVCAKRYDELFLVFQLKTIAETHQELRRKYPNLL